MMNFLKPVLFIFIAVFFTVFSSAQEDLLLFEEEEIACEDLPSVFSKYEEDVQLSQLSFQRTLRSLTHFLKTSSEEGQFVKEELEKMIKDLEEISVLSMESSEFLSNRAYDISFFLPDCVDSASAEQPPAVSEEQKEQKAN